MDKKFNSLENTRKKLKEMKKQIELLNNLLNIIKQK